MRFHCLSPSRVSRGLRPSEHRPTSQEHGPTIGFVCTVSVHSCFSRQAPKAVLDLPRMERVCFGARRVTRSGAETSPAPTRGKGDWVRLSVFPCVRIFSRRKRWGPHASGLGLFVQVRVGHHVGFLGTFGPSEPDLRAWFSRQAPKEVLDLPRVELGLFLHIPCIRSLRVRLQGACPTRRAFVSGCPQQSCGLPGRLSGSAHSGFSRQAPKAVLDLPRMELGLFLHIPCIRSLGVRLQGA